MPDNGRREKSQRLTPSPKGQEYQIIYSDSNQDIAVIDERYSYISIQGPFCQERFSAIHDKCVIASDEKASNNIVFVKKNTTLIAS